MRKSPLFNFFIILLAILFITACSEAIPDTVDSGSTNTVSKKEYVTQKQTPENSMGIALRNLTGETVSLDDFHGKVVVVNFWATWCGPCIREMPDLVKLREKYKNQNVEVVGIVVSSPESHVKKKAAELNITYPILYGDEETAMKFGGFTSIPQTFILNAEGKIVEKLSGMQSYKTFERHIQQHI